MRILIDADGCPVVDIAVKVARQRNIECLILCDTSHFYRKKGAKTVTVPTGADSVDYALVSMVKKGEVVVTQDYGLAAMCLAKKAIPIRQDGMVYNSQNIDALLFSRYAAQKIRNQGGRIKNSTRKKPVAKPNFETSLRSVLESPGFLSNCRS